MNERIKEMELELKLQRKEIQFLKKEYIKLIEVPIFRMSRKMRTKLHEVMSATIDERIKLAIEKLNIKNS